MTTHSVCSAGKLPMKCRGKTIESGSVSAGHLPDPGTFIDGLAGMHIIKPLSNIFFSLMIGRFEMPTIT